MSRLNLLLNVDLSLHKTKTGKGTHKKLEEQGNMQAVQEQDCSLAWDSDSLMDTEGSGGASRLVTTQINC